MIHLACLTNELMLSSFFDELSTEVQASLIMTGRLSGEMVLIWFRLVYLITEAAMSAALLLDLAAFLSGSARQALV